MCVPVCARLAAPPGGDPPLPPGGEPPLFHDPNSKAPRRGGATDEGVAGPAAAGVAVRAGRCLTAPAARAAPLLAGAMCARC